MSNPPGRLAGPAPTASARRPALPQVPVAAPPPFRLPAEHFAAALLWLLVGAALLPWLAPRLAEGRVLEPPVFSLVHILVLGVVSSAIFGALNQFVPGGLEVPLKSVRLAHAGFWLLQAGILSLAVGFWLWDGRLQLVGWVLAVLAVGAASINILPARRRSSHGKLVGLYLSVAHSFLGVGMAIGLARIGETLGWWSLDRLGLVAAHFLLGAVGFGTLTAVGVGSRMLPTFLLAQGDDRGWLESILALTSAGLLMFVTGAVAGWPVVARTGGLLLLVAGAAVVALGWRWFRRRRRALDPSLRQGTIAFMGLALAVLWGGALWFDPHQLRRWAAVATLLIIGWLVMLVVGVMAKIVSHLSYIHLFRAMPGFARVGNPNLLLRADWMSASWVLLATGALGLAVAIEWGQPRGAAAFAWVWSAGVGVTIGNYVRMLVLGARP